MWLAGQLWLAAAVTKKIRSLLCHASCSEISELLSWLCMLQFNLTYQLVIDAPSDVLAWRRCVGALTTAHIDDTMTLYCIYPLLIWMSKVFVAGQAHSPEAQGGTIM